MIQSTPSLLVVCSALCACLLCAGACRPEAIPAAPRPVERTTVAGSGENVGYHSFQKARAILDRGLAAYGAAGTDETAAAEVTLKYSGTMRYQGHYNSPSATKEFRVGGSCVFSWRFDAMAHSGESTGEGHSEKSTTIVMGGRHFHADSDGLEKPGSATPAKHRRRIAALLPPRMMELAAARAASLRWLGEEPIDGSPHDLISFADDDGVLVTLYVSRSSGRLARLETLRADPHEGDVVEWVRYGDQRPLSGTSLVLPRTIEWLDGHSQWTVHIADADLQLGARTEAAAFAIPEAHRSGFADWAVKAHKLDPLAVTPIGRDLYVIEVPDKDCKVMFAVMDDHVIAVEAPVDSETGERILAAIRAHVPDRPVRYLVMSHHHEHYIGASRAFVNAGVTLVTTPGNEALLRERAAHPFRVAPDLLARAPREPKVLVFKERHVFEDAHHRLEIYDLGPGSKHTDEYVITYVPSEHLLFQGDLGNFADPPPPPRPRPRPRGLLDGIRRLGLDVQRIVQSWPLKNQKKIATLDDLVRVAGETPPP